MCKCKTIQLLQRLVADEGDWKPVASSCLDLIQNIQESGASPEAVEYFHLFVDEIYKAGNISLLDHLRDGVADCAMCQEMTRRMGMIGT